METDDGYAVLDDIQDGIHVEPDGVSEAEYLFRYNRQNRDCHP